MKKFLIISLIVLILFLGVGAAVYYISNATKPVTVQTEDETTLYDDSVLCFGPSNEYVFKTSGTVSLFGIYPNSDQEFYFLHNGQAEKFSNTKNWTSVFEIKQEGSNIKVSVPQYTTIDEIFEMLYTGEEIELPSNINSSTPLFYVSIAGNGSTQRIFFTLNVVRVTGISLSEERIII